MSEQPSADGVLSEAELTAHAAFLGRLSESLVRDAHLAADLVQETLTVAVSADSPGPRGGSLRAWLAGVLRNRLRMRLRTDARRERRETTSPHVAGRGALPPGPSEIVARLEMQQIVVAEVRALPEEQRRLLVLRFYEGRSPQEIAALDGVPASTVRSRLARALEALRKRLDQRTGGDRAAWHAALLVPPPRGPLPHAPWWRGGVRAATSGAGVVAMASKKGLAAAVVALALVVTAGVHWVLRDDGSRPVERADAQLSASSPERAGATGAGSRGARSEGADDPGPSASHPGGEFAQGFGEVDRERDLHGRVIDVKGRPIAGAQVTASRRTWGRTTVFEPDVAREVVVVGERTTDDAGRYLLPLRRGSVVDLRVVAEGFADARFVGLTAGGRFDVTLDPGASLEVDVLDDTGTGVADARVVVWRRRNAFEPVLNVSAVTGSDGRARFDRLSAGRTLVRAEHPEWACPSAQELELGREGAHVLAVRLVPGRTLRGDVRDADTGEPIVDARIGEGSELRRAVASDAAGAFTLRGWAGRSGAEVHCTAPWYGRALLIPQDDEPLRFVLQRGDEVVGRVLGVDREPIVGALLSALAFRATNAGHELDSVSGRTDDRGRFRLTGLRRDLPHMLIVQAPGHGILRRGLGPHPERPGIVRLGDLLLEPGLELAGRVTTADGESPVPGARVVLEVAGPSAVDFDYGASESRTTDDLGRFRFVDLSPDRFRIRVTRSGHQAGWADIDEEIELTAHREGLVLRLPALHELRVRVRDSEGVPVSGVSLAVGGRRHLSEATTDAAGEAVLVSPVPGPWTLRAFAPRDVAGATPCLDRVLEGVDPSVGSITVELTRAGLIRGMVLDPAGAPVPRTYVSAYRPDGSLAGEAAVTDAGGVYELRVPVAEALRVVADGRQQSPESWIFIDTLPLAAELLQVTAPADDVVLQLQAVPPDRTLEVAVRGPDGRPVAGAEVIVTTRVGAGPPPDDAPKHVTPESGAVTIGGLRAQRHHVWVRAISESPAHSRFAPPAVVSVTPDDQTIEIAFRRADWVTGRFETPQGQPLAGVRVRLLTTAGLELGSQLTDEEGRYRLLGVAGHGHQVTAVHERSGGQRRVRYLKDVLPGTERVDTME